MDRAEEFCSNCSNQSLMAVKQALEANSEQTMTNTSSFWFRASSHVANRSLAAGRSLSAVKSGVCKRQIARALSVLGDEVTLRSHTLTVADET
eukprot:3632658-Amphidinium_carterae.1